MNSFQKKMFNDEERYSDMQINAPNVGIEWQIIVELALWMGGFYQRLAGVVKRGRRKIIVKLCLTSKQLRTILAKNL